MPVRVAGLAKPTFPAGFFAESRSVFPVHDFHGNAA
jgi:hypothetical protein